MARIPPQVELEVPKSLNPKPGSLNRMIHGKTRTVSLCNLVFSVPSYPPSGSLES